MLVNPPCVIALGKDSADEVLGKRDEDLIPKEFAERSILEEEQLLSTGMPLLNTEGRPRLDPVTGEIRRALLTSKSAIRNEHGAVTGLVVVNRDITIRKRIEQSLVESEARFHTLYDNATIGLYRTAPDGTIVLANPTLVKLLGYSSFEDLANRNLEREGFEPSYERRAFIEQIEREGEVNGLESAWTRHDGSTVFVRESARAIRDATGRTLHFDGTVEDITERKKAEEKITLLLAEKELLLKEVHHRIKNNMNTMMSLLSLQAGAMQDPGSAAALKDARRRMQSMMVLYDKLYRSEGFRELSLKEYLVPLVHEIAGNCPNSEMVTIETLVDDFILDARILSPLGIIINELVTNTMKHAFAGRDRGAISVTASLQGTEATIVVRDDGVGLPEGFELHASTGFGLRLVAKLTEQIGGTLRIARERGATFILSFDVR